MSPYWKSSILNAKQEQITKVKHLCSFIGFYKTLHIATCVLAPLEDIVGGKELERIIIKDSFF